MEETTPKPVLPPNWTHIQGPLYVVRTQAGFKQAIKHFHGEDKRPDVEGYPKSYPAFINLSRHEWRDLVYVQSIHLNDLLEKLSKA